MPASDIREQTTVVGPPADVGPVRASTSPSTRDCTPRRVDPSIRPGDVLGRYRIEERLGEGGMGVIFRAFDPQLQRDVALKILRPMGSEDVLGHVTEAALREARALAQLSHPSVVEIFDVGTFGGQVFMAMELLHGVTLGKWLSRAPGERPRSWREIVDVLVSAGRGLAAAHARGVVHRDFKPDNVVITRDGGVRVVDFGLATPEDRRARARQAELRDTDGRTHPSESGVVAGTPTYMSPEQLRGEPLDARSDQFSFCVALFRALHDARPYSGGSIDALLEDMEGRGQPVATRRRLPAAMHRAMLRGLSIDPDARWPSMDALLDALRTGPSQRGGLALALSAVAVLGAGAVALRPPAMSCEPPARAAAAWSDDALAGLEPAREGSELRYVHDAWERFMPRYQELGERWHETYVEVCEGRGRDEEHALRADRAISCLYRSLESAEALAEVVREADAKALGRLDDAMTAVPDPRRCVGDEAPPDDREELAESEHGPRLARATMLSKLGRYADALAIVDELHEQLVDPAPRRWTLALDVEAGFLLDELGRYDEAVARLEPAALEARALREDELAALAAVRLMRTLGQRLQRRDEALQWMRFTESSLEGAAPSETVAYVRESMELAHARLLQDQGELQAARASFERAQALCTARRDVSLCDHTTMSIAMVLDALGEHQEARERYERGIADYEARHGSWHPKLATPIDNLGIVLYRLGDYEGAAEHHARSLAIREAAFGPDNPEVGLSLTNLGLAEIKLERLSASRAHQERAVANWRASLGEDHPHVAAALTNLAVVRALEGAEPSELIELHRQALQIRETALGPDNPEVGTSLANLGNALGRQGEHDQARHHLDRARALWAKIYGEGSEQVASIDVDLGALAEAREDLDEAAARYDQARRAYEQTLGPDHGSAVWARFELGSVELERSELPRATELLERSYRELEAIPTEIYWRARASFGLARLRAHEGQREQARALAREAKARTRELEPTDQRGPELRERVDAWLAAGMSTPKPRPGLGVTP